MTLSAPTWEVPCKQKARVWQLSDKQIVTTPIGELFPETKEAAEAMAEHMSDILPDIIAGLKEASMAFAAAK